MLTYCLKDLNAPIIESIFQIYNCTDNNLKAEFFSIIGCLRFILMVGTSETLALAKEFVITSLLRYRNSF